LFFVIRKINIKTIALASLLLFGISATASAQEITAIDFNGDLLGKVIPDGKVVSFDNELIGNVNADSFIVNENGELIGGVIPQGIVIGNDNKMLGKVNNDGSVRLSSGKVAGKVLPNGLAVDDKYNVIGAVLFPGLVYSDTGKTIGRLTGDGNYANLEGKTIGFISADGYAYKTTGDTYAVDGKLISSKMVISQDGKFIGSVALGGKVTDFDSNIIGSIKANGFAYNEEGKIIGRIVRNGYAISDNGQYLGFISYNGDVVKDNKVVGHLRFDDRVVNDKQEVIGFSIDIAATATDLQGNYIGRIMPDGKIARAKENIGSVAPRGNVVDAGGQLIGKIINSGPVFDYRAKLVANASKDGKALSLDGSELGKISGNKVFNNIGVIIGATSNNRLIIDKNNKTLGMSGISEFVQGLDKNFVSPFGYIYSSDGAIAGTAVPLGAMYDMYGAALGYITPNAEVLNDKYAKIADVLQFGYANFEGKQIRAKNLEAQYVINRSGDILGSISENNLVLSPAQKSIAKIMPDMSVSASDETITNVISPKIANAFMSDMVIAPDGSFVGYANETGNVYDREKSVIGKISEGGVMIDATGAIMGELSDAGVVVDDTCTFLGVVTPRGDVRNYKNSMIGNILQNGQVVSEGGTVIGRRVLPYLLIDMQNAIYATPSVNGFAFNLSNSKLGCVDQRGYLKDEDGKVLAASLRYRPVMNFSGKIVGRSVFDGSVVDEDSKTIGRVAIDGTVVSAENSVVGHLFLYRYAFDNNNAFLGRVLESGRVINNRNEDVGVVDYEGYVLDKNEKIGYATYDLYVYDDSWKAIGYIEKDGRVKSFSGNHLGQIDRGFLLNDKEKLIGRVNRDYWVKGANNVSVGELSISGKLYNLNNEMVGTLAQDGRIKSSSGQVVGVPYLLQYYSAKAKKGSMVKVGASDFTETEENDKDIGGFSSRVVGIALTPDGDYLGNIMDNGDVLGKDGSLIGKKMPDGLIIDNDGNLIGIEEVKRPKGQDIFVPAGTFGQGGAYGTGTGVGNLGPGGGYGPGERYNAQRAAALSAAQDERRQAMSVRKISTNIDKSSFDGMQKDWSDLGIEKNISSWRVDMSEMILADKPIPAVLARSIDSSNPTPVTAFVERNVYSEEGRNILIPAGSRFIGSLGGLTASEEQMSNSAKVQITWDRLIRPDGSTFKLQGLTGDAQGRGGALGYLDKQLLKKYSAPIVTNLLTSAVSVMFSTKDSGSDGVESSRQQAMNDAREDFQDGMKQVFQQIMQDAMDIRPLTYVPAGTRIIVYPNVDLWLRNVDTAAEESAKMTKPDRLIDDDATKAQRQANDKGLQPGGSSGGSADGGATAGKVVYEEGMVDGVEAQKSMPLLIDNSKAKKSSSSGGVPPVTVSPIGTPPPPPPSYNMSGTSDSSDSSDDGNIPQLF